MYEYPRYIKGLHGDIGIAPLEVNEFNRNKSNIKALEYTAIGVPAVFTKINPYDKMILQASSEDEFISHIESLRDIDYRYKIWSETYENMKNEMYWEDNEYRNLKNFVKSYLNLTQQDVNF